MREAALAPVVEEEGLLSAPAVRSQRRDECVDDDDVATSWAGNFVVVARPREANDEEEEDAQLLRAVAPRRTRRLRSVDARGVVVMTDVCCAVTSERTLKERVYRQEKA